MKNSLVKFSSRILFLLAIFPLTLLSQNPAEKDPELKGEIDHTKVSTELAAAGWSREVTLDSAWIHYDDVENFDSWGFLINGEIYDVMSKWDPDSLVNYEGWAITKIKFIVVNQDPVLQVKIWEGPDATEIYSQDVPVFNINDWTIVELDSAVTFDHTQELYFGYNVDMSQIELGGFVTATDDGPPIDEYGNLVRLGNQWLSDYNNHNLRALFTEPLIADFEADKTTVCDSTVISFTNLSNEAETYSWIFQGGTPFISNLENPTVTYYTPGVYDVTLTITSGGQTSTEQKQDYITVLEIPGQIEGEDLVCEWTEAIYTVAENVWSTYTWEVTNGEIVSGQGTHMVQVLWHDPGTGYLSLNEETAYGCGGTGAIEVTIDECTGSEEHGQDISISIIPNPTAGDNFVVHTGTTGKATLEIYNMNGVLMHERQLTSGSNRIHSLGFPKGLYLVRVYTHEGIGVKKLAIR